MGKLRVLDLFSGIGGFSLGLERTGGFETVAFCEMKPHAQRVLAKNFPGVPCHDDVTTYDFKEGEADVITAGFPCQDISYAGLGAGLAGARSGLYREVIRAIRVVRPFRAVLENVAALLGRGLDTVLGDLATVGYDAEWHCIPASAVGAPHRRDRIWIVANPGGEQHKGCSAPLSGALTSELSRAFARNTGASSGYDDQADAQYSDADGIGSHRAQIDFDRSVEFRDEQISQPRSVGRNVPDANGRRPHTEQIDLSGGTCTANADRHGKERPLANSCIAGLERSELDGIDREKLGSRQKWPFGSASKCTQGSRGQWTVEPDVGRVAHGVPMRVDRLAELGNAVVPQIPEILGRAILASIASSQSEAV